MLTAWLRMFMPAHDPEYVLPDAWYALTDDEKRRAPRPQPILRPRRVRPASERGPGFSLDEAGPYLKLPDGTVYRDRASAAHRLWRQALASPSVAQVVDFLPKRTGRAARLARARTPDRVLGALVAFGLVHAGMTRVAAASLILGWEDRLDTDPKKRADQDSMIWRELHLPPVGA